MGAGGRGGGTRSRSPFCSPITNINMPFVWWTKVRTPLFIFSSLALSQILFQTSFQNSCIDLKPNFHMKAGNKQFLFKKSIQLKIYSPVEYKYRLSKNKQKNLTRTKLTLVGLHWAWEAQQSPLILEGSRIQSWIFFLYYIHSYPLDPIPFL